jgi:hypothetical protein
VKAFSRGQYYLPGFVRKQNIKFDYFNLSPLILLLWGLFSISCKPIIPVASGFGWDGVFYGRVAMDFHNMIGNIDSYHANRIFPGILIHYVISVLDIPLNLKSVLSGYQFYYIIILVCSSVFWILISNHLLLKPIAKWIGFFALFINFPLFTLYFYYPALTDGTAFFIGLLMLYSFLGKNNILLLMVTVISFFTWPVGIVIGFLLFIYSDKESAIEYYKNKKTSLILILLILSPFLALAWINIDLTSVLQDLIVQAGLNGKIFSKSDTPNSFNLGIYTHLVNNILNIVYIVAMYWFILKKFDFILYFRSNFQKNLLIKFLISVLILIFLIILKRQIFSPSLPTNEPLWYVSLYFTGYNVRFPFQFIVGQISYWGPVIILLIIFFKDFIRQLQVFSLPVLFAFLFTVLFSINSEGRPITNFYPFIVVVLLKAVDFSKFRNLKLFTMSFVLISLLYSKVWLPMKLPSSVFPESIWTGLDTFPMQWYFMNFGYFMNFQMYLVHGFAAVIFFIIIYFTIKNPKQSIIPAKS